MKDPSLSPLSPFPLTPIVKSDSFTENGGEGRGIACPFLKICSNLGQSCGKEMGSCHHVVKGTPIRTVTRSSRLASDAKALHQVWFAPPFTCLSVSTRHIPSHPVRRQCPVQLRAVNGSKQRSTTVEAHWMLCNGKFRQNYAKFTTTLSPDSSSEARMPFAVALCAPCTALPRPTNSIVI